MMKRTFLTVVVSHLLGSRSLPYGGVKMWVPFQNALLFYRTLCTIVLQMVAPMLSRVTRALLTLILLLL